jgi:hypothetical protein
LAVFFSKVAFFFQVSLVAAKSLFISSQWARDKKTGGTVDPTVPD